MEPGQTDNLIFTTLPWQNVEETVPHPDSDYASYGVKMRTGRWSKKPSVYGAFTAYEYGTVTTVETPGAEVIGYPQDTPVEAVQIGVVCSPASGLVVIDVDDPEAYAESELGDLLPLEEYAYSRRGRGGHIYLDMRQFAGTDRWPTQGPIQGGDIKSAGYVAAAGSLHYSGDRYEHTGKPVLVANEMEATYLVEAKRQAVGHGGGGYHGSGRGDDDTLCRATYGWVFQGMAEEEIRPLWQELASEIEDASWPFAEKDFQRHLRGALRKYETAAPTLVTSRSQEEVEKDQEAERILARFQERLSGVCAGQETLRGKGATDVTPQNAVTCEDPAPLKTPEEILKKVHDEGHEHRLSRDWDKLPAGSYKVFKVIGEKIAEGNATKQDALFLARLDPSGKIRAALLASKYLLSVDAENNLQVMPDRAVYVDTEWVVHNGVKVNMAKYPGIAEGTNPLVGSNHKAEELDSQVMLATLLLTKDGHGPSRRAVAHYLNERLPSGKKAVSEDMVRTSTKRLMGSGRLVMVKLPQYHRLDHAWTATPAVYGRAEDHPALAMRKISLKDGRTVRLGEDLACAA